MSALRIDQHHAPMDVLKNEGHLLWTAHTRISPHTDSIPFTDEFIEVSTKTAERNRG